MTTGIDVRTRECYVLEDAKNKVLDLMTTCKDINIYRRTIRLNIQRTRSPT